MSRAPAMTARDGESEWDARPPRRRLGLMVGLLLALLAFVYWLSPYVAATRFALAAQAGQTDAIVARLDLPGLRANFARQIVRAYIASAPKARELDPLSRQLVASVAGGFVSAIIADYLTPQAIADLLARRRGASRAGELLGDGVALPRLDGLGSAWTMLLASGFTGPATFTVAPPPVAGEAYRLHFGLGGWSWKLRAIELPQAVLDRLAGELTTRIDARP